MPFGDNKRDRQTDRRADTQTHNDLVPVEYYALHWTDRNTIMISIAGISLASFIARHSIQNVLLYNLCVQFTYYIRAYFTWLLNQLHVV